MFFSNTDWPQLTAPFYSILFETSICQFNSSKFGPIMSDEVREHLTRDQSQILRSAPSTDSFIQNHSRPFRFPAPCWCVFSSVHLTHFLQGSGQRTGMAIAESWFCAQWPIFVLFLRVCVWIIVWLEDPMSVTYTFFDLLVFDRMHDAMRLNKMSRTSSRNIGPQQQKYSSIFNCTRGLLFIPVFTKPILSVCC